ncbi:pyruvate ferredoxin oxidoreductase, partial [Candidatus Poribacteria bacterium]
PAMVNLDGFYLSHTAEPVEIPDQELVDRFLPPYDPEDKLDPDRPFSYGAMAFPESYARMRWSIHLAMEKAKKLIPEVGREFGELFGREYDIVEEYRCEGAETVLIAMSTLANTSKEVIDLMRGRGEAVGLLRVRWLRPFPKERVREVLRGVRRVCVIDRDISFGYEGALATEVKAAIYGLDPRPEVYGFVMGIGGVDVPPERIEKALRSVVEGEADEFNWFVEG